MRLHFFQQDFPIPQRDIYPSLPNIGDDFVAFPSEKTGRYKYPFIHPGAHKCTDKISYLMHSYLA
jgi:hypothetical protein